MQSFYPDSLCADSRHLAFIVEQTAHHCCDASIAWTQDLLHGMTTQSITLLHGMTTQSITLLHGMTTQSVALLQADPHVSLQPLPFTQGPASWSADSGNTERVFSSGHQAPA